MQAYWPRLSHWSTFFQFLFVDFYLWLLHHISIFKQWSPWPVFFHWSVLVCWISNWLGLYLRFLEHPMFVFHVCYDLLVQGLSHWSGPVELGFFDWLTLYLRFFIPAMGVHHVSYDLLDKGLSNLVNTSCTRLLFIYLYLRFLTPSIGVHHVSYDLPWLGPFLIWSI